MKDPRTLWVDLSWLMFKNWHGGGHLSIIQKGQDEEGYDTFEDRPTQHVFGTVQNIYAASQCFEKVVLAVDGGKQYRRDIFPGYKAGRKKLDFPIFDDQGPILRLCTHFPNVFVCWVKGYEADDLMATAQLTQEHIVMWTRDRDIMQTAGNWAVLDQIDGGQPVYLDVPAYLEKETGISGLSFLPLWWKCARGDSSDKIPPAIPRLPATKLIPLVLALAGTQKLDDFYDYFEKNVSWKHPLDKEALERNYRLVLPRYLEPEQCRIYRPEPDPQKVYDLLVYYEFRSLFQVFFPSRLC